MMGGLAIKELNAGNLRSDDPVIRMFIMGLDAAGQPVLGTPEDWLRLFAALELSRPVPVEVRDLHTVAKSAAGYGGLYYPIFTVAENQMARVGETAVTHLYRACGGPPPPPKKFFSLFGRLRWLRDHGNITSDQHDEWDLHRQWRNATTHAEEQMLLTPGVALQSCERTTLLIDQLFDAQ
jgi:hypothetical protein